MLTFSTEQRKINRKKTSATKTAKRNTQFFGIQCKKKELYEAR